MTILIYFLLLLLGAFFIVVAFLYLLLSLDSLIRDHDLPTSKRAIKAICKIILEYKPEAKNFYDLGCGRGTLALGVKKKLPQLSCYAIDKSWLRLFFAKLKTRFLRRKITFQRGDLFAANLKEADIVYTYLWYDLMPPLEKKLQQELKRGAIVITNTSHFPNWKPVKTYVTYPKKPDFEKLFVYIKD